MARVLVLGSYAPSLVSFRGTLLRTLAERGHQVFAVAPPAGSSDADIERQLASWGVRYEPLRFARNRIDPRGDITLVARLVAMLRRHEIDRLLTYTLKPNVYGAAAAAVAGVPSAAMITGLGSILLGRGRTRNVALAMLKAAALKHEVLFVQNEDDMADLVDMGVAPRRKFVRTMGSGVELDRYEPAPMPDAPAVLMLSRLIESKGVREYLRAAERIAASGSPLVLRLAGMQDPGSGGVDLAEIRAAPVDYLGPLSDVRPALAQCSIYCLPSWHEGTPRSVLEAMAMGRPIVTTEARGCRETVWPGENGIRVPVGDVAALVDALLELADAPETCARMGRRSRELAVEHFDAREVARTIADRLRL